MAPDSQVRYVDPSGNCAVPFSPADIKKLQKLARSDWEPEALAVGKRAAYLWCPEGAIASPLIKAVDRELLDEVTTRLTLSTR